MSKKELNKTIKQMEKLGFYTVKKSKTIYDMRTGSYFFFMKYKIDEEIISIYEKIKSFLKDNKCHQK